MEEADESAKRGFEINNDDCWAQHAVSLDYLNPVWGLA